MSKTIKHIDLSLRFDCGCSDERVPREVYDALVYLSEKGVIDIDSYSSSEEERIVLEWAFESFVVGDAYSFGVEINNIEFYEQD